MVSTASTAAAGLYVHVPFCARACPYCDFDFEVGRTPDVARYLEGIRKELGQRGEELAASFDTLYLGGGTPSILSSSDLAQLMDLLHAAAPALRAREVTLEANPEHVDAERISAWQAVGINRVSLGVQSFDPRGITQLGRVHTVVQARDAVARLQSVGLRLSLDLILGWQGQDHDSLALELDILEELEVAHVSAYALTIEEDTPWPRLVRRGLRVLPDHDTQGDLMEQVQERLITMGLGHYEVASYAKPEQESQHNRKHWRWQSYVGLGPSAASAHYHEGGGVTRRNNARGLERWAAGEACTQEVLGPQQSVREGLWLALRQLGPISLSALYDRFSEVGRDSIDELLRAVERRGLLRRDDESFALTPGSWRMHDTIGLLLL